MSALASRTVTLRSWTKAQRAELASLVERAFRTWTSDWYVPASAPVTCDCEAAGLETLLARAFFLPLGRTGAAQAWVMTDGDGPDALMAALFEVHRRRQPTQSVLATELASQAWDEMLECLRTALGLGARTGMGYPVPADVRLWSGPVTLKLRAGALDVDLLLTGACVEPLVTASCAHAPRSAHAPLTPVFHAIADRPVRVKVDLSAFELDLGTVQDLRVGDVVPLPHRLSAPVIVSAAGKPLCNGFIGRQSGSKAVELARDTAVPSEISIPTSTERPTT
ncbi:FliM/FliN family flagellar motor switch protein [Caenimonas sp. SL110]|uniref:FliM/FliN family flagellar motor switch protein n=1 Tax=Caenimonas sp. SL110 TaxID=1450524 RepID=UPI000654A20D|nr:FliM/FliN family flagellar motor C-terminal domain-containing protein [Caenimonas sp. SL110]